MFNSLSYATQLVNAGVPREQAEVHAQVLQSVYEQEHEQYATKADFVILSAEVKTQIQRLEVTTSRIETTIDECKNEFASFRSDLSGFRSELSGFQSDLSGFKADLSGFKSDLSGFKADLSGFKAQLSECRSDISGLKFDMSILKNSHKYLLWIGGVMTTTCFGMFGINLSLLLAR